MSDRERDGGLHASDMTHQSEYTAEALANDIVGSMRAFWEDFGSAQVFRKNVWTTALIQTTDDPPAYYEIRVRKVGDD